MLLADFWGHKSKFSGKYVCSSPVCGGGGELRGERLRVQPDRETHSLVILGTLSSGSEDLAVAKAPLPTSAPPLHALPHLYAHTILTRGIYEVSFREGEGSFGWGVKETLETEMK